MSTRRQALKTLTAAAIASTVLGRFSVRAQTPAATAFPVPDGPFKLPPLPYAYDALEPHIDAETMRLHHDKHHAAYVNKLNEAVAKERALNPSDTSSVLLSTQDVDELLKKLLQVSDSLRITVRNNGGGHANHSLFWQTLSARSGSPHGIFADALQNELGGLEQFKDAATKAAAGIFGSGWVWLVLDDVKKLTILTLPNQDSPFMAHHYPLFGIDVWEHAYYLKYHNVRADYLKALWNVVNWDFISNRYAAAMKA